MITQVSRFLLVGLFASTASVYAQPDIRFCQSLDEHVSRKPSLAERLASIRLTRDLPSGLRATPMHAVAMDQKLWRPGQTIRIRFLEGDRRVVSRVRQAAKEWTRHANLKFRFVDSGPAEIRVSFRPGGSHSRIGTDSGRDLNGGSSMNFGWFDASSTDTEIRRTTLHEFGHALGLSHEHMSPRRRIAWNKPIVVADMARKGWDSEQVDRNIFRRLSVNSTRSTAFDEDSIMAYRVPARWTLDGTEIGSNSRLSEKDKTFISQLYPGLSPPPPTVAPPRPPTPAPPRPPTPRPPTRRPRPPPTPRAVTLDLQLENAAVKTGAKGFGGRPVWRWTAYLTGRDLQQVVAVDYHLHPSFQPNVHRITSGSASGFPFSATGWGTFALRASVHLRDGRQQWLQHSLQFEGAPPVVPGRPTPKPKPKPKPRLRPKPRPKPASLRLTNSSKQLDGKRWRWTAFLLGDVDQVDEVTYLLHPTFRPNRIKVGRRAGPQFPYTTTGWGTFELGAEVRLKDGTSRRLRHQLRFY